MMNLKNTARATGLVVALIASTGVAYAQGGTPAEKPTPQARDSVGKAPEAAGQAAVQQGVHVTLPVKGLTKENASKAQAALAAITREIYSCPGCKGEFAKAGKCPGCGADM